MKFVGLTILVALAHISYGQTAIATSTACRTCVDGGNFACDDNGGNTGRLPIANNCYTSDQGTCTSNNLDDALARYGFCALGSGGTSTLTFAGSKGRVGDNALDGGDVLTYEFYDDSYADGKSRFEIKVVEGDEADFETALFTYDVNDKEWKQKKDNLFDGDGATVDVETGEEVTAVFVVKPIYATGTTKEFYFTVEHKGNPPLPIWVWILIIVPIVFVAAGLLAFYTLFVVLAARYKKE